MAQHWTNAEQLATGSQPTRPQVQMGSVLAGKYELVRPIAEGGMGVVYAARHIELDQLVAVKLIRNELLGDPSARKRFLNEARAVAALKSPHVAHVLDAGHLESGQPYLVIEYLQGEDLAQRLARTGPLPIAEVAELMVQACDGVAEAHRAGIVHRDLKPENLFIVGRHGRPFLKILDFGASKRYLENQGITRIGRTVGSPSYMSPEQVTEPRTVDPRSDVWTLGVVLYELTTGRRPFEARSVVETCERILDGRPTPPCRLRPDLPRTLEHVILRCLERHPGARFASASELRDALERFCAEVGPGAASSLSSRPTIPVAQRVATGPAPIFYDDPVASADIPKRRAVGAWLGIAAAIGLVGVAAFALFEPVDELLAVDGVTLAETPESGVERAPLTPDATLLRPLASPKPVTAAPPADEDAAEVEDAESSEPDSVETAPAARPAPARRVVPAPTLDASEIEARKERYREWLKQEGLRPVDGEALPGGP